MSLRRGFKAEADRISLGLRRSLGLAAHAPIDLMAVLEKMSVPAVPLSSFNDEFPDAVHQLSKIDQGAFSAATLPLGDGRHIIVHNDSHSHARQRSNIAHEIAHILLGHAFTLPIDSSGCRNIDRDRG
jgi:IrrE N-terminal-like domain